VARDSIEEMDAHVHVHVPDLESDGGTNITGSGSWSMFVALT
jgi:hypothetical protein